jgi:hypothetical protein
LVGPGVVDRWTDSERMMWNQTPTCNEHHALNDAENIRSGCDVTGIGATACWHGCFCPASVVDFQKGERYSCSMLTQRTCLLWPDMKNS